MESILLWATILSPVVGVIAIIAALIIARRSSKETKKQIEAVHNLLDVFVASQNPTMMEAKREYKQQLAEIDEQIQELYEDIQIVSPFFGRGPRIEDMEELDNKQEQCKQLEALKNKRKETEEQLNLILAYLNRVQKNNPIA